MERERVSHTPLTAALVKKEKKTNPTDNLATGNSHTHVQFTFIYTAPNTATVNGPTIIRDNSVCPFNEAQPCLVSEIRLDGAAQDAVAVSGIVLKSASCNRIIVHSYAEDGDHKLKCIHWSSSKPLKQASHSVSVM